MDGPYTNQRHAKSLLGRIWLGILAPGILAIVFLNIPAYVFMLDTSILPKYFYFIFAFALLPLVLLSIQRFISYLVSPVAVWAIALLLLNCVHLFTNINGSSENIDIILYRIQWIQIIILLGFAITKIRRDVVEQIFVALAVLLPCVMVIDFVFPGFFYPPDTPGVVLGRAAGPFLNSNNASQAVLIAFILACPSVPKKFRSPLIMLCGIGVLLTFSRAAMAAWLLIFAYLLMHRKLFRASALMALFVVSLPLLLGGMQSYLSQRADLDASIDNIEDRLSFFSKRKFNDDSAVERAAVVQGGWEAFVRNPVTGLGAGMTMHASPAWPYHASTHNQLIFLAAEYGIPGILAWCWLDICLIRGKYFQDKDYQRLMTLFFLMMTPFSHTMFDTPSWLLMYMLVAQRPPAKAAGNPALVANAFVKRNA